MQKILATLILSGLVSTAAMASDAEDALATVHHFTDALNKGDMASAASACADIVEMVDDLPPYEWHGAGACAKWLTSAGDYGKATGFVPGPMTLAKARQVLVTADHAYIVLPASFTYKQKGKDMKQTGAVLTVSVAKDAKGWHMVAWAWADGKTVEAQAAPAKQ